MKGGKRMIFTQEELKIIRYDMDGLLGVSKMQRTIKSDIDNPKAVKFAQELIRQDRLREIIVEKIDDFLKEKDK